MKEQNQNLWTVYTLFDSENKLRKIVVRKNQGKLP